METTTYFKSSIRILPIIAAVEQSALNEVIQISTQGGIVELNPLLVPDDLVENHDQYQLLEVPIGDDARMQAVAVAVVPKVEQLDAPDHSFTPTLVFSGITE